MFPILTNLDWNYELGTIWIASVLMKLALINLLVPDVY